MELSISPYIGSLTLLCHEAHHQELIDGGQPLDVCLQDLVTSGLQVLFVHHSVADLLSCRDVDLCEGPYIWGYTI